MKKTILALGTMLPPEMAELEENFNLIRLWKESDPEATLQAVKQDVVAIVSTFNGMQVSRAIIEALPNLELIAQYGAGVNNIDVEAAKERHIAVTSTPETPMNDTADTALGLIINTLRRFVEADVFLRIGKWNSSGFPLATSLTGKRVGIIGMGRIGQAIARRCEAFEMPVSYFGPRKKEGLNYPYFSSLTELAANVDVLVCSCIGGAETHHIINTAVLKALGPKGILINVARGSVVNTEDLLVALSNKDIAGAGLDVYENEPSVPESLISMDNVVLLPHIGGHTHETKTGMGKVVIANIEAHFNGRPLLTPFAA
ncbi:MAG TPA: 2-hydroxyacid dehydrogenase [Alphaproteobacteria bacterium]|nr:2-hydroxyacid dehydrogenase [Alphaproteobacteria bacterium]HOO50161.1 2-hydroxyacid dehydrogenase [Alphaproteobacteria bacterium]